MSRRATGLALGVLLLVTGVLLLLQALRVITDPSLLWTILFVVAGSAFWYRFLVERVWWAAIPGGALVGLGVAGSVALAAPGQSAPWGGPAFLGALGVGFAAVRLRHRQIWWAVIPAGVLLTLAAVAGLSGVVGDTGSGALLFAGLAATFALLAALPPARHRWAWIPAGVLLALALVVAVQATVLLDGLDYVWPVGLLVAGAAVLWRTIARPGDRPPADAGPVGRLPAEPPPGDSVSEPPGGPAAPSADRPVDDAARGAAAPPASRQLS